MPSSSTFPIWDSRLALTQASISCLERFSLVTEVLNTLTAILRLRLGLPASCSQCSVGVTSQVLSQRTFYPHTSHTESIVRLWSGRCEGLARTMPSSDLSFILIIQRVDTVLSHTALVFHHLVQDTQLALAAQICSLPAWLTACHSTIVFAC